MTTPKGARRSHREQLERPGAGSRRYEARSREDQVMRWVLYVTDKYGTIFRLSDSASILVLAEMARNLADHGKTEYPEIKIQAEWNQS